MKLTRGFRILWERFTKQGVGVTARWAADHTVRYVTGANILCLSQITPQLHVGGQYRQRGLGRMQERGITAVVNMRSEFDNRDAGIAPEHYLFLPTEDDHAPSLEDLHRGSEFIAEEVDRGGVVYVHCGSGIGRAATMAAAYLISTGMTADEAWETIRASRPFIKPTEVQVEQIRRFEADVRGE
jgi:predicted protein tyrosine phosphatase